MKSKTAEFFIQDYDSYDPDNLGVFFYKERILFGWKKDFGIRSYKFKLRLEKRSLDLNGFDQPSEEIEFIHTMNLKDLPIEIWETDFLEEGERYVVERVLWEQFVKEVAPDQYKLAEERLRRKLSKKKAPNPIIYTASDWCKGYEFLEFNEDSASSWGGPFEQDGKKGACVSIVKKEPKSLSTHKVEESWNYFNLPPVYRSLNPQLEDIYLYECSTEEKVRLFNELPLDVQVEVIIDFYRIYASRHCIEENLPFKLRLCGNDDTSYTKYFISEEDLQKELEYLRRMQPLDMRRDIYKRGYHFTN